MNSYRIKYSDSLEHHGILGMKWGDRNGPPYPLGSGDHSSSEKKAGWKQSLSNESDSSKKKSTKSITKSSKVSTKTAEEHRKGLAEYYKSKGNSKAAKDVENLSPEEMEARAKRIETTKKVLIGTTAAVGIGAAVVIAAKYGAFDKLKTSGGKFGLEAIKTAQKESLENVAYVISKDTTIHRMEAAAGKDISKSDAIAYIAHNPKDVKTYMHKLADWSGTGQRFDTKYKLARDAYVADEKAIHSAIDKLWASKEYRSELEDSLTECYMYVFTKRQGLKDSQYLRDDVRRQVKDLLVKMDTDSSERYGEIMYAMVGKGKDSTRLQKELISAGYDAMEDLFDKGTFTKQPVIWLKTDLLTKIGEEYVAKAYL